MVSNHSWKCVIIILVNFTTMHGDLIFPDIGYMCEPTRFMMFSTGSETFHIGLKLPNIRHKGADCIKESPEVSNLLEELYDLPQKVIPNMNFLKEISPRSNFTRDKRFLTAIIGVVSLLSLGTSLYGLGKQYSFESDIDDKIRRQDLALHELMIKHNQLLTVLDEQSNELKNLGSSVDMLHRIIENITCIQDEKIQQLETITYIQFFILKLESFVYAALKGDLHPDLVTLSMIRTLIKQRSSLRDTLLDKDPSVLYNVGKVIPLSYNHAHRVITLMIIMPIIRLDQISHIYDCSNIGFKKNNTLFKYTLPENIITVKVDGKQVMTSVNLQYCHTSGIIVMCNVNAIPTTNYQCLDDLNNNVSSNCSPKLLDNLLPVAINTQQHIMLRGFSRYSVHTQSTIPRYGSYKINLNPDQNTVIAIDKGKKYVVGGDIFTNNVVKANYDIPTNLSIKTMVKNISLNNKELDNISKEIQKLRIENISDWDVSDPSTYHFITIYTLLLVSIAALLAISWCYLRGHLIRKNKSKKFKKIVMQHSNNEDSD
ncbi:glycoprotein [Sanxia water strider virus 4]|uniref:Glycoprotein n=1 Tax=Sanxia water strider virus 4 TaxID=1608063 RepID=A0A0B5KEU9_9MONO|nr:glycoprotein [Sanxia water strider virus 4]AJG39114.1 glycoprotein [Sanxia water strider virus 4]